MFLRRIFAAALAVAAVTGGVTGGIALAAHASTPTGPCTVWVEAHFGREAYQFNTPTMADASAAAVPLAGQTYTIGCADGSQLAAV